VHQTAPDAIAFVVRRRGATRAIAVSMHGRWPHIVVTRAASEVDPGSFVRLLRSRLEGATLQSVETVEFERVILLGFEGLEGPVEVVAELMGHAANAMLCAGDRIVGVMRAARTLRAASGRGRQLELQRRYVRPSVPAHHPLAVTAEDFAGAVDASPGRRDTAWRTVLGVVAGIGPALAWETCLRAGIEPSAPWSPDAAAAVARSVRALGERATARDFAPHLYRDARGDAAAYAPFPLECYAAYRAEPASMSDAVAAVTARLAEQARRDALRGGLAATVDAAITRARRARAAVEDDLRAAESADDLRRQGELILAYLPQIAPGATAVEVPGFDGTPVSIRLDPTRTGVENAQVYFKRYARAAAAKKRLPERRAALDGELGFLEGAANAIQQAESDDDLWEVEQDLVAAGLRARTGLGARTRLGARTGPGSKGGPRTRDVKGRAPRSVDAGRAFEIGGWRVRVGRSARENDYLTFEVASPDDLWLHARGMPGAHVIVTGPRGAPPEQAITAAAAIAAFYSAGRESAKVPVDVTARKHVRRIRGGRPGQVHYSQERTVLVTPARQPPR
jgi:predicted ribosome quality control (RQC) complex YloA/Tae2 family protein